MSATNSNNTDPLIKAYTSKELATLYGVSIKTLRRWLQPHLAFIGEKTSIYYTMKQVRIIFERIGEPG